MYKNWTKNRLQERTSTGVKLVNVRCTISHQHHDNISQLYHVNTRFLSPSTRFLAPLIRFLTIDTLSLTIDTLSRHRHAFSHHRHAFSPSTRFLSPSTRFITIGTLSLTIGTLSHHRHAFSPSPSTRFLIHASRFLILCLIHFIHELTNSVDLVLTHLVLFKHLPSEHNLDRLSCRHKA